MTRAIAPVAAEIIAGRPPRNEMETAIVKDAKRPRRGSTPAMIEKEMASGISARATTSPASTSVRSILGERNALRTVGADVSVGACKVLGCSGVGVLIAGSVRGSRSAPFLREEEPTELAERVEGAHLGCACWPLG